MPWFIELCLSVWMMTSDLFYYIQVGKENAEVALLLVEYDKELKVLFFIA